MFTIIGIIVVFVAIIGGYLMEHGNLSVLWQPAEFVIIFGAATGAFIISSPKGVLQGVIKNIGKLFSSETVTKEDYMDLLMLLNQVFWKTRKEGLLALESDVDNPAGSEIFNGYPKIRSNPRILGFICDNLRVMISASMPSHELESLLETDIEALNHSKIVPAQSIAKVADGLPGLGIVAAVLGVVLTMGMISEPPEVLGHHIGAALVGTFLGVLACYGFVGPMGTNLEHKAKEEEIYFNVIKSALVSFQGGVAPQITIETARRTIPADERPTFMEVEEAIKKSKARG
ncbi:MAG: flagellar motor stator protein MotA [Deltaproteobacteria bacterium]|nr:flagellar motor stator protein MotA [Deltaproteobacteria bacterium]